MSAVLSRKQEELSAKQRLVAGLFTKDENGDYNMSADTVDEIQRRNRELEALAADIETTKQLAAIEGGLRPSVNGLQPIVREPSDDDDYAEPPQRLTSIGSLFVRSGAYKAWKRGSKETGDIEEVGYNPGYQLRATTMTEAAGFAPETTRTGRVVDFATRPPRVIDAYPVTTTDQIAVLYMEETTFTNNAAEAAENTGSAGEAALAYTEQSSTVRKIAVHLPVTDEQLADVGGIRGRIDNRLELMLRQRLDLQLVSGNGTAPNISGILDQSIQTQAKGTDPVFDAIHKGINLVQSVGFAEPDTILMHPDDWQDIALTRTADGIYIMGNPASVITPRLWGLPVITSTACTEDTAIVGDFAGYAEVAFKQGVEFAVTNSHASEFLNGIQRIKATIRCAHVLYRLYAFCSVTGV